MAPDLIMRAQHYIYCASLRKSNPGSLAERGDASRQAEFEKKFEEAALNPAERSDAEGLRQVLRAASLWELASGFSIRPDFERRYRNLLEGTPATLDATLVTDFRAATRSLAGYACWPLVDNADPNRLWMFYFPSPDRKIPGLKAESGPEFQTSWLCAIDCRNGEIIRCIDLKSALGKSMGRDLSTCALPYGTCISIRPQGRIMTEVDLVRMDGPDHGIHKACAIIEKESGKVTAMPAGTAILSGYPSQAVGVAALGNDFFFLDDYEYQREGERRHTSSTSHMSLFQVDSQFKVRKLTEYGRRPALTPFDAYGREPKCLFAHDGKLAVFGRTFGHAYDPDDGSWNTVKTSGNGLPRIAIRYLTPEYRKVYIAPLQLRLNGEKTGWRLADVTKPMPGHLRFSGENSKSRVIAVSMEIPEDFRKMTQVKVWKDQDLASTSHYSQRKEVPFEKYANDGIFSVVILNQTEDDFILALQLGDRFEWRLPSRENHFLPFLWKVPKTELLKMLEEKSKL